MTKAVTPAPAPPGSARTTSQAGQTGQASQTGTPRSGGYARGAATADAILKAALKVLIEDGAADCTVRRIAAECGMKVGNVSYHFPRKEMLVQLLLDELLDSYDKVLDTEVRQSGLSAEQSLRRVIELCLEDITTKRTTRLFIELWAMANQNAIVAERVQLFYARAHAVIGEFVAILNPALSPQQVHTVALYISATMEGTTPFLGFEKPWAGQMPAFIRLAARNLVELARTITPDEIDGLQPQA